MKPKSLSSKSKLAKPVIIALSKKLILDGYSLRKTAKILNIDVKTVMKYSSLVQEQTKEQLEHISNITDTVLKDTNNKLITLTAKSITKRLKETNPSLGDLTNLYETTTKVNKKDVPGVAVQFNQYANTEKNEFGL